MGNQGRGDGEGITGIYQEILLSAGLVASIYKF